MKDRIERRLGVVFGAERVPPSARQDFRFLLRLGAGKGRQFANIELIIGPLAMQVSRTGRRS